MGSLNDRLERLEHAFALGPKTWMDSPTGPELAALFDAIEEWREGGEPALGYDEEEAREVLEEVCGDDGNSKQKGGCR